MKKFKKHRAKPATLDQILRAYKIPKSEFRKTLRLLAKDMKKKKGVKKV